MTFTSDESAWPIVTLRWVGAPTDEDVSRELARMDGYLERGQRFGVLVDGRGSGGLSPEQRNQLIGHMKSRADVTARLLVQAVVIDNVVQRTLYYGVKLLFPSPFLNKAFCDPASARAWLAEMLGTNPKARGRASALPPS